MDVPSGKADAPGWMVMHPEAVARIVEESLRDDAWWVAARTGRFVGGPTVWADCVRPPSPAVRPRLAETEDGSGPG